MSKTIRKDHYVEVHGEPCFGETWEATMDKKKWYKPGRKQKEGYVGKVRPVKKGDFKRAMMHPDEDGEVILPKEKKTDVWYYN
jgi:hypothetical protein